MIGCDIVAISRVKRIFERYGVNFLDKFLSKNEQKLIFSQKNSQNVSQKSINPNKILSKSPLNEPLSEVFASQNKPNFSTIAGFFAAKEAASKALGCGICELCGFLDIEIFKDAKNAPKLNFSTKITQHFGIKKSSLSIAHDGGFAIAVAVLQG